MSVSGPHEIRFEGVRVRYDSARTFDELVVALLGDIGENPVSLSRALFPFESLDCIRR